MEITVQFSIDGRDYILIVRKSVLRDKIRLFECEKDSIFLKSVPIEVTARTMRETLRFWLVELKRYLTQKRNQKRSQPGSSHSRNSSG